MKHHKREITSKNVYVIYVMDFVRRWIISNILFAVTLLPQILDLGNSGNSIINKRTFYLFWTLQMKLWRNVIKGVERKERGIKEIEYEHA